MDQKKKTFITDILCEKTYPKFDEKQLRNMNIYNNINYTSMFFYMYRIVII